MTDLALVKPGTKLVQNSKAPAALAAIIDLEAWAQALVFRTAYKEPNPDYLSTMLALQTIMGMTMEEVFRSQGIKGLQEILADTAGATTGPLEITDLYVAETDFETGAPCYVVVTAVDLELGTELKFTTGAQNVQATFIGLLKLGTWPIKCQFKRGDSKDRGGKYLIFMLPPD